MQRTLDHKVLGKNPHFPWNLILHNYFIDHNCNSLSFPGFDRSCWFWNIICCGCRCHHPGYCHLWSDQKTSKVQNYQSMFIVVYNFLVILSFIMIQCLILAFSLTVRLCMWWPKWMRYSPNITLWLDWWKREFWHATGKLYPWKYSISFYLCVFLSYIHTYTLSHTLTHSYTHLHTHSHTLTHARTHTHTCTHTPMHTRTHTLL